METLPKGSYTSATEVILGQNRKSSISSDCVMSLRKFIGFASLMTVVGLATGDDFEEEHYGVIYASPCEVCKIMVEELEAKLEETGKAGGLVETGYHLDNRIKNKKQYKNSELQLIESMESACEAVLEYKLHKERKDSTRFSRGESQTFSTLHGLVAKGVKVDLGIPYELWDKPSAEISQLKTQCDDMMEKYETEIEDWFHRRQSEETLKEFLCKKVVLKNKNFGCLYQVPPPPSASVESAQKKTEL